MKKLNPTITKKLALIDSEIQEIEKNSNEFDKKLRQEFGVKESHDDCNFDAWDENDWNYASVTEQKFADFDYTINRLNAKKAAALLIAYNIARRGKVLHQSVAFKKLEKLGDTGKWLKSEIENSYSLPFILNAHAYLHAELNQKYKVLLLDKNLFNSINNKIENLSVSILNFRTDSKEYKIIDNNIQKLKTILGLFNNSVARNIEIQKQKFSEMAY